MVIDYIQSSIQARTFYVFEMNFILKLSLFTIKAKATDKYLIRKQ